MIERFKILRNEYRINFKLSLVASLLLCILLFLFFPFIASFPPPPAEYQSLLFTINDLAPITQQDKLANPKPPDPKIFTIAIIDEPEILPDEEVKPITKEETNSNGNGNDSISDKGTPLILPQLPFVPRQILEVLPQNTDENIKGLIVIKLKIGTDGKVIEHKVITNTTGSQKYSQSVINAAYKSKWEPVKIKANNVVYWIEKTYRFN